MTISKIFNKSKDFTIEILSAIYDFYAKHIINSVLWALVLACFATPAARLVCYENNLYELPFWWWWCFMSVVVTLIGLIKD